MSCCGKQRDGLRQPSFSSQTGPKWTSGPVDFEYMGQGTLTVTGPLTGTVYYFSPRTRLRVHGADAPSLVSVPNLKPAR